MPAFPLLCLLMRPKTLRLPAKLGRMYIPASVYPLAGNQLVEHLVEYDVFKYIAGNKGLVKEAMDANQPVVGMIGAKTYGGPWTLRWPTGPGNAGLNTVGKIGLVQLAVDGLEVEMVPPSLESLVALPLGWLADEMLVLLDIPT
jgi:hypothetical protein